MSRVDSDTQSQAYDVLQDVKLLVNMIDNLQHDYDVLLIENEQQREELYELRKLKAR